mgnify:CR=1 FL=1
MRYLTIVALIPLLAAPLCVLINRALPTWVIAVIATWLSFGAAINAIRDDEEKEHIDPELALANAPEKEDGSFVVPKVVG